MMINSDRYAERTVCSCLISSPCMSHWNAAQGGCIYFYYYHFFLLLITEALSLPIFRPCAWIWRRPVHNSVRKSKVVSFYLYCWDRLMGKHCKSLLVLNLLTCHSLSGGRWIVFFFCDGEKITRWIVCMWEDKSSPYVKFWYLACSLSLWKSNTHLQTGEVCSLWRSDPSQFWVPRAQGMASLKPAHTGCMSLLCPIGLTCWWSWSDWLHVQLLRLE